MGLTTQIAAGFSNRDNAHVPVVEADSGVPLDRLQSGADLPMWLDA
jgi:hypothetical protein